MGWEVKESFVGWLQGHLARPPAAEERWEAKERAGWRPSGVAGCDICGRTLLFGETTSHFCREGRELTVCALCEGDLLAKGFVRAA